MYKSLNEVSAILVRPSLVGFVSTPSSGDDKSVVVRSGGKTILPTTSRQSKPIMKKCSRRDVTMPSTQLLTKICVLHLA